ncbi:glycosyltransferase family 4 protein [Rhodopseudomonas palustris]|uniref:glycosyltransferase family 4 protein n=1 Tax=Rhodopseudomonas palustris TaxID=1076 RepID=UPI002ACED985|nr:glycosyltransferase family 4 protein [Rhodopseudomonas palustris]WQG97534.1 glycosyltransferase family 4 protein [Rhodopseudomonas palustris]
MKVLLYPHSMEVGGSQINALQLAGAVRDRGHQVIVASEPGPLMERVRNLALEHVELPLHRSRPSPRVSGILSDLVKRRGIDVIHGHEWPPIVEAFFGGTLRHCTPVVGTIMSMSVVPFLPRATHLTVGTELIRRSALASGYRNVDLLEPPVDTVADNPSIDGRDFRACLGIRPDEVVIAMICRLVPDLKLEGMLTACDAVRELARAGKPVRLVIVGDGRARDDVARRAASANADAGYEAVLLAGEMADASPAYAAADILVGQGGSALRGMAFAKPLVVVGEEGFSELLTPDSAPMFLQQGWYGLGAGTLGTGAPALHRALERLVGSPEIRSQLGSFGRRLVQSRFSLGRAAEIVEGIYVSAIQTPVSVRQLVPEALHVAAGVAGNRIRRRYLKWTGAGATDDQNQRQVIAAVFDTGSNGATPVGRPERQVA